MISEMLFGDFHDTIQRSMGFYDVAIVTVKGNTYRILFLHMKNNRLG